MVNGDTARPGLSQNSSAYQRSPDMGVRTEVAELGHAPIPHQNVLQLEISVGDAFPVQVTQALEQVAHVLGRLLLRGLILLLGRVNVIRE